MRKLLTAVSALVAALAFFVVGNPSANAFGSEVLGCDAGLGWTANSCHSSTALPAHHLVIINYTPQGTSGTYTTSWTVHTASGAYITQICDSTYSNTPCISSSNSGSCAAGSLWCQIAGHVGTVHDKVFTAALTLTQSGRTRTITAAATIYAY